MFVVKFEYGLGVKVVPNRVWDADVYNELLCDI